MNKIVLKVIGDKEVTLHVDGVPKCEADLLEYDEYKDFYYSVGLGAPVVAEVTVKKGLLFSEKYNFSFFIRGNAMSHEDMLSITDKYSTVSKCEEMKAIIDQGMIIYIFSFTDNSMAYKMYSEFDGICNIGAFHMKDQSTGLFLVKIEYHQVG